MAERKVRLKFVLLGEPKVGKTSLIERYVSQAFSPEYVKTLGATVTKHVDNLVLPDGNIVWIEETVWDIMGQKHLFEMLQGAYLHLSRGALAVFDVTRRDTLEALREWVEAVRRESPKVPVVVLGNKADLLDQRAVSDDEALNFCKSMGIPYLPTSAKTGLNVEAAFALLCQSAVRTFAAIHGQAT